MPQTFKGERTLMRIFIGESDHHHGKPLYQALVELFRSRGYAGVTVLRGIAGFGSSSKVHTESILRLSMDLPIVVELVEADETLQQLLPELDGMIAGGLITMERVQVVMYRPARPPAL
jgi:hypothetical protein